VSDAVNAPAPLRLFEGYGVEIEYMIVDRRTLDVRPVADRLLEAFAGEIVSDVETGAIAWSNELVLHLIELKTNGPAGALEGLPALFQADVARIDALLEPLGARLLGTAMHPWMDPATETRLWPHDAGPIYATFDRIFGCRGHGWSNLQSAHLNLPFGDDREFHRLHAAIRVVLPLLPALAASSPVVEGRPTGLLDNRLAFYRTNSARVPSVAGQVVPEPLGSRAAYEEEILGRIYRDLGPLDPEGVLRYEWANARGAIARFDRNAIEIRVLDAQERPEADLAIAAAASGLVKRLAAEGDPGRLDAVPTGGLAAALLAVAKDGERSVLRDPAWLRALGLPDRGPLAAGEAWRGLLEGLSPSPLAPASPWREALALVLEQGPLARRILRALGPGPDRPRLRAVYGALADALAAGRPFGA